VSSANLAIELDLLVSLRIGGHEYQATIARVATTNAAPAVVSVGILRRVIDDLLQVAPAVVEKLLDVAIAKP
jgi:hypothetical protein